MTTTSTTFREGDVVRYSPEKSWCRERFAIATERRGSVVLVDTYWGLAGYDRAVLTANEAASAELSFNLAEVTKVTGATEFVRRTKWERYAEADQFVVTSQHGLTVTYFVRSGAEQSRAAELEQQRTAVEEALRKRDWALSDLQFQRERYHQMLADPTVRPWAV